MKTIEQLKPLPFNAELWRKFAGADAFLDLQMKDMLRRAKAQGISEETYLEAQYNSNVFENSHLAALWNEFVKKP